MINHETVVDRLGSIMKIIGEFREEHFLRGVSEELVFTFTDLNEALALRAQLDAHMPRSESCEGDGTTSVAFDYLDMKILIKCKQTKIVPDGRVTGVANMIEGRDFQTSFT